MHRHKYSKCFWNAPKKGRFICTRLMKHLKKGCLLLKHPWKKPRKPLKCFTSLPERTPWNRLWLHMGKPLALRNWLFSFLSFSSELQHPHLGEQLLLVSSWEGEVFSPSTRLQRGGGSCQCPKQHSGLLRSEQTGFIVPLFLSPRATLSINHPLSSLGQPFPYSPALRSSLFLLRSSQAVTKLLY